ncbi:MAG TPA: DUF2752 domain-containing protein [Thermoanaerobaculia bacterium]|nr:DUF2752 domain-containing protein [Thermoanaerobaculia bacterium]
MRYSLQPERCPRPDPDAWRRELVCRGTLGIGIVAAAALLYVLDPATTKVYPPCPVRWSTDLLCPGCGSLRALHRLLHGELVAALQMNPLIVALGPIGVAVAWRGWLDRAWLGWTALVTVLAYGVLRNVPWWPFTLLAQQTGS